MKGLLLYILKMLLVWIAVAVLVYFLPTLFAARDPNSLTLGGQSWFSREELSFLQAQGRWAFLKYSLREAFTPVASAALVLALVKRPWQD